MYLTNRGRYIRAVTATVLVPLLLCLVFIPVRDWISPTDIAMLQLLWIAWTAQRYGQRRAVITTIICVALLNWCFVEPYYTLHVNDPSYLISFMVMTGLGMFISYLSDLNRRRLQKARLAMSQMRAMYMLAKGVNSCSNWPEQCQYASRLLSRRLKADILLKPLVEKPALHPDQLALPLGKYQCVGWLILSKEVYLPHQPLINAAQSLLSQSADTLELQQQSRQHQLKMELEQHRAMLLRSLSHDLRTPLATIMGASSMLADADLPLTLEQRQQQAANIYQQSKLLDMHFEKVLELSRAQLSGDDLQMNHFSSDELIAGALARRPDLNTIVRDQFQLSVSQNLCGHLDLLEIAVANMLENAVKFGQAPFLLKIHEQPHLPRQKYRLEMTHPLAGKLQQIPDRSHGLGSLICKTVATLHQGQFHLQLPKAKTDMVISVLEWQA
jgi:two-component system sensor histidine kinase KdpD